MPLYEFYNEEIDESYEMMMTYDNKVKYLKKNPHIREIIGAPNIVGGHGDRVKTDGGMKDVLNKVANNFPGSPMHERHGSKDIKTEKTKAIVSKHVKMQERNRLSKTPKK